MGKSTLWTKNTIPVIPLVPTSSTQVLSITLTGQTHGEVGPLARSVSVRLLNCAIILISYARSRRNLLLRQLSAS